MAAADAADRRAARIDVDRVLVCAFVVEFFLIASSRLFLEYDGNFLLVSANAAAARGGRGARAR